MFSTWNHSFTQTDYTIDYFPLVYKADLEISRGNYETALGNFEQAFDAIHGGRSVDFTNSIVCAIKTIQDDKAYQYLDSLLYLHVDREFLDTFKGFEGLRVSPSWNSYINNYSQRQKNLPSKINEDLKAQLHQLVAVKEKYKTRSGGWNMTRDQMRKEYKKNFKTLISLLNTYGFPNERLMGAVPPFNQIPGYRVFHNYFMDYSFASEIANHDFIQDFKTAIEAGFIEPHAFAYLASPDEGNRLEIEEKGIFRLGYGSFLSDYLYPKFDTTLMPVINKNRSELGLEPLDEYFIKVNYAVYNRNARDFLFNRYKFITIIRYSNQATFESVKDHYEPLRKY